jgi:uncharacterized membrane protein YgdD (TMEM256/DUF423 family)
MALSALVLAAMGSHLFNMNGMQHLWQTASQIHLFSAASLLGVAALLAWLKSPFIRWGAWLIILGTFIFCGSIYLHVISGHTLKNLTPAGGLIMMSGWVMTALAFLRKS